MPCDHKFRSYLDLSRIDFEPTTLIVGTFNPAWPASNTAEWFYGQADGNCFWDVLPRLYGRASLMNATHGEWKQFCHDERIALTDLISSIDDADQDDPAHNKILGGHSDKAIVHNFDDFVYVDIVQLLKRYPTIKNVYLARAVTEAFWKHLWNPVTYYCSRNGIRERKLLTPTGELFFRHGTGNNEPDDRISELADHILSRWQQEWHF